MLLKADFFCFQLKVESIFLRIRMIYTNLTRSVLLLLQNFAEWTTLRLLENFRFQIENKESFSTLQSKHPLKMCDQLKFVYIILILFAWVQDLPISNLSEKFEFYKQNFFCQNGIWFLLSWWISYFNICCLFVSVFFFLVFFLAEEVANDVAEDLDVVLFFVVLQK